MEPNCRNDSGVRGWIVFVDGGGWRRVPFGVRVVHAGLGFITSERNIVVVVVAVVEVKMMKKEGRFPKKT